MSKDDIQKAVDEAAKFADADKKHKEEVDARNNADSLVFQCEKSLTDFGDKVTEAEKSNVQSKIDALKAIKESGSVDDIKAKTEDLQKAFYEVSQRIYQAAGAQQAAPGQGAGPSSGAAGAADNTNNDKKPGDDGFVDADYKEV
jgi:molecular chaperone DnaK